MVIQFFSISYTFDFLNLSFLLKLLGLYLIFSISCCRLFQKAGQTPGLAFVPIVNLYLLFSIVDRRRFFFYNLFFFLLFGWCYFAAMQNHVDVAELHFPTLFQLTHTLDFNSFLFHIYPLVSTIMVVLFVVTYTIGNVRLAIKFEKDVIYVLGLAFVPILFYVILGFDNSVYNLDAQVVSSSFHLDPLTKDDVISEEGVTSSNLKGELLGYTDHLDFPNEDDFKE